MNRRLIIIASILITTTVPAIWLLSTRLQEGRRTIEADVSPSVAETKTKQKPICDSIVNPNVAPPTDCIPQYVANLPPDPGKAGETQFIDTNKDGVRDDVERYIEVNYGHSRRAVGALRQVAKQYQEEIELSGKVSREEAWAIGKSTMKIAGCFINSVPENIINEGANERVGVQVLNTPERYLAAKKFEVLMHGGVFDMDTSPIAEQCGYDPDQLPN